VTFLFPMILAAGAAAAAPVIIHLIMRTKPRRVVFPPLRFVLKTHRAQISRLRLKHLILLAMRIAVIVLIALLIARTQLPGWGRATDQKSPAAVVVVLDASGSMSYRQRGASLLAAGKRLAGRIVEALPPRSRVAVVSTGAPAAAAAFHGDVTVAAEEIAAAEQGYGDETLAAGLARALSLLEEAPLPRKEIYVVSDMTARAWRDATATLAGTIPDDVRITVLRCGEGVRPNIAIGEVRPDVTSVPVGAAVTIDVPLAASETAGEVTIRAELDGRTVDQETVRLAAGGSVGVKLDVRPRQAGVRHGRIVLQQGDAMELDDVRYFTLQAGSAGQVLVLRDAATVGRGDETSFLMANAVAPAGSSAAGGHWVQRRTLTPETLTPKDLQAARIVLLANVSALTEAMWQQLEGFARGGGHVWVVPGELTSAGGYNSPSAQHILPAAIRSVETLAEPMGWQSSGGHAMLDPFANQPNPPLAAVTCKRRLALGEAAGDARVVLRYTDGTPAILTRPVGAGSAVLWNFSPARSFSNLAGLAQFPILTQRTVRLLLGGEALQTGVLLGRTVTLQAPQAAAATVATIRRPGGGDGETVVLGARKRALTVPADELGHWDVEFSSGETRHQRGFSVNTAAAESDLTGVEDRTLTEAFGAGKILIVADAGELDRHRRTVAMPLDLTAPLLLVLLALLIAESFFANRFYRIGIQTESLE